MRDSISHEKPKFGPKANLGRFLGKVQNEIKSEGEELGTKYTNLKRKFSALRDVSFSIANMAP